MDHKKLESCEDVVSWVFIFPNIIATCYSAYAFYLCLKKYITKKKNSLFLISSIFLLLGSIGRVAFHIVQLISEDIKDEIFVTYISITLIITSLVILVYFSLVLTKIRWVKYEDFAEESSKFKLSQKQLKIVFIVGNLIVFTVTMIACISMTRDFSDPENVDNALELSVNMSLVLLGVVFIWICLGLYYFKKFLTILKGFDKAAKKSAHIIKFVNSVIGVCLYLFVIFFFTIAFGIISVIYNEKYKVACTHFAIIYIMLLSSFGIAHSLCLASKKAENTKDPEIELKDV
ncbi:hypothetical protein M0813_04479 [Anaeramoeba flamelloides]|uniref:Serpentine receptor class gamma n=1 Tax=Anaeramoeba flamelloides TaxID=1746091 RepID=A0ABQ8XLM2_9EUKA|nr:hypothetical protein M0813_04479 [Anaeramoeba flamelloides]